MRVVRRSFPYWILLFALQVKVLLTLACLPACSVSVRSELCKRCCFHLARSIVCGQMAWCACVCECCVWLVWFGTRCRGGGEWCSRQRMDVMVRLPTIVFMHEVFAVWWRDWRSVRSPKVPSQAVMVCVPVVRRAEATGYNIPCNRLNTWTSEWVRVHGHTFTEWVRRVSCGRNRFRCFSLWHTHTQRFAPPETRPGPVPNEGWTMWGSFS